MLASLVPMFTWRQSASAALWAAAALITSVTTSSGISAEASAREMMLSNGIGRPPEQERLAGTLPRPCGERPAVAADPTGGHLRRCSGGAIGRRSGGAPG